MTENADTSKNKRQIWVRGFFMLLMIMIFHLSATVMIAGSIVQFIITLLNETPNSRLTSFGRSLGQYLNQLANFLIFSTEEIPFPFNDWPTAD